MNLIKLKNLLLLLLIFALALYLRVFNLNFDDYWFDEQVTFFISNPNVNIDETLKRIGEYNNSSDYIFAIILKYFFRIFSYSPEIGRLVPVLFSVLSIPAIAILAYQIKKNNGYLIVFFLTSINFYLISYAQELRVYSFDFNTDLSEVKAMLNIYKIQDTKLPAMVIDDELLTGFQKVEDLDSKIKQSCKLQDTKPEKQTDKKS